MKKYLILVFLVSFSLQAQYKISGELNPSGDYTWAILYKIEGARQVFVKSSTLKKETKNKNNKKIKVSNFEFTLPADAKAGAYRVAYKTEDNGFADFLFNKEDVSFSFNPNNAEETIRFSKSKENKLYQKYKDMVATEQYKTDSLQILYLKKQQANTAKLYTSQLKKIASLQKQYLLKSKGLMVNDFIKATNRYNSPKIASTSQSYLTSVLDHFFDTIDFDNKTLYNSTFLVDRITDYVFYMNYSDDPKTQKKLHQKAVDVVLKKATNPVFRKDILEFLITQFTNYNNVEFADVLLNSYYKKLPKADQKAEFIKNYLEKTMVSIGRIAPEITWNENGKNHKLSSINDAQNYVLVFWSTGCSHCLREIPQLHTFSKNKKNTKIIAFSLENNDRDWIKWKKKLPGWHHVIGLKKWENPIARQYQIYSTPTYIILDKTKKIIAKPTTYQEVKKIIEYLE